MTDAHRKQYNAIFCKELRAALQERRMSIIEVERAMLKASRCLPRSSGLPRRPGARDSLWWSEKDEQRLQQADDPGDVLRRQRQIVLRRAATANRNPSEIWSIHNKFVRSSKSASVKPPLKVPTADGGVAEITDPQQRVNALAESYAALHEVEGHNVCAEIQRELDAIPEHLRKGARVGVWEIQSAVDLMKPGRCADFMRLKAEHLRALDSASREFMLPWINRVVRDTMIPPHWKIAITTAVPKPRKDLSELKNWRPIAVTPVVSRLCENIINMRVVSQWEERASTTDPECRSDSQFGFRKGTGTTQALLSLVMFIEDGLDRTMNTCVNGKQTRRNHATLLVSIDCTSAFCKINGALVMRQLRALGMHAEACWIGNLLLNRRLRVRDGDVLSELFSADGGSSQGSILGPLKWRVEFNPLLRVLEALCRQAEGAHSHTRALPITYADDLNFAVQSYDRAATVDRANELLAAVQRWSEFTGIPIGSLKATWINRQKGTGWNNDEFGELRCCGHVVKPGCEDLRLLGVRIPSMFTFNGHVDDTIVKCTAALNMIRPLAATSSADQVRILYNSLVLSVLLYAAEAWYPHTSVQSRLRLDAIHYEGCRLITRATLGAPAVKVLREAGFRSLGHIVRERLISMADKIVGNDKFFNNPQRFGAAYLRAQLVGAPPLLEVRTPAGRALPAQDRRARPASAFPTIRDIVDPLAGLPRTSMIDSYIEGYSEAGGTMPVLDRAAPPCAFQYTSPRGLIKANALPAQLRAANEERMRALPRDAVFVYTDGSADTTTACVPGAAAGAFVIEHRGTLLAAEAMPVGPYACSYVAEAFPVLHALDWLRDNRAALPPGAVHVCFVGDSQSFISALAKGPLRQDDILPQAAWGKIGDVGRLQLSLSFHFVFSHVGAPAGNQVADTVASSAMHFIGEESHPTWTRDAIRHRIAHARALFDARSPPGSGYVYQKTPSPSLKQWRLSRRDEQLLLRARVGVIPEIGGERHSTADDCPRCNAKGVLGRGGTATEHLFVDCPCASELPAQENSALHPASIMWTNPIEAVKYLSTFRAEKARKCEVDPTWSQSTRGDATQQQQQLEQTQELTQ